MVRTQIQLPEAEYKRLRDVAAKQNRSLADCVREGIALFLGRSRQGANEIAAIAGKYAPVATRDLKPHDQAWADSVARRR